MVNSLSSVLSVTILILSPLKDSIPRILGWQGFFSTLYLSSHCSLGSMAPDEKSAVNFIKNPFYMKSYLFLEAFKILYLLMMCLGVNLSVFLLGVYWFSCTCRIVFFIKFRNSSNMLSSLVSLLFWDFYNACIANLIVSHRYLRLC